LEQHFVLVIFAQELQSDRHVGGRLEVVFDVLLSEVIDGVVVVLALLDEVHGDLERRHVEPVGQTSL